MVGKALFIKIAASVIASLAAWWLRSEGFEWWTRLP
jgi:hypothetical protein